MRIFIRFDYGDYPSFIQDAGHFPVVISTDRDSLIVISGPGDTV